jgi:hypothetical protein
MDAVAGVEDEGLHLGVPTAGLMSEMNACVQQFLNANADHDFPFVRSSLRPEAANHPAEHGINLSVVMAARLHTKAVFKAVSLLPNPAKGGKNSRIQPQGQLFLFFPPLFTLIDFDWRGSHKGGWRFF